MWVILHCMNSPAGLLTWIKITFMTKGLQVQALHLVRGCRCACVHVCVSVCVGLFRGGHLSSCPKKGLSKDIEDATFMRCNSLMQGIFRHNEIETRLSLSDISSRRKRRLYGISQWEESQAPKLRKRISSSFLEMHPRTYTTTFCFPAGPYFVQANLETTVSWRPA